MSVFSNRDFHAPSFLILSTFSLILDVEESIEQRLHSIRMPLPLNSEQFLFLFTCARLSDIEFAERTTPLTEATQAIA